MTITRSDRVKAGLCTLSKRIDTCEIAHKEYIETLLDRSDKEKEGEWILKVVHDYDKIYDTTNMFISGIQRSVSRANKPNTNIKIENVKFEIFEGDLRRYGRFKEEFIKHIRPIFKSEEEAFVLKSYLIKSIREITTTNGSRDVGSIRIRVITLYGCARPCKKRAQWKDKMWSEITELATNVYRRVISHPNVVEILSAEKRTVTSRITRYFTEHMLQGHHLMAVYYSPIQTKMYYFKFRKFKYLTIQVIT